MHELQPKQMFAAHLTMLVIIFLIPMQWAFYLLMAFYLWGIPKTFKDREEKIDLENKVLRGGGKWWEILGTEPDATMDECKRVRKLLSKIYHPDGGEAPNSEHMARINRALEDRMLLPDTKEELPGIH